MECKFVPEKTKMMMIHYFDLEGLVESVPNKEEVKKILGTECVVWRCNIKPGDVLSEVFDGHSLMGRGYFILEGSHEEELKKMAEQIKELFIMK